MAYTREILAGEELPEKKLKAYLLEQGLIRNTDSPLQAVQFAGGFSNLTYLLLIEGRELVLRRPPAGAIKRGHDMGREYRVLSHLYPHFPKVPETYAYTERDDIIGAPFYLMEKVDGIIISGREARERAIPRGDFAVISDRWLDTFIDLHHLNYKSVGLADLGRPEGYVARQVHNWSQQYLKAATAEVPSAAKVMDWMDRYQPHEYDFSLIHNDYKYDNVVFADDSWTAIRAVLDWEMCTLGDPLMDLGTSLAYWITDKDPEALQLVAQSPTTLQGNPTRTEIVEKYAEKSGKSVDHLTFYYVYGLFKVAVIGQQIFYRYQQGYTKDPRFAKLDQFAKLLCDMAWQAVQKDRIDDLF